jgi:hypothetical protein
MKKTLISCLLSLSLSAWGFSSDLSLKLGGGLSYLTGGDLNRAIQSQNEYYQAQFSSLTGELQKLSFGLNFDAELVLHVSPSLGLGVGAGFLRASHESRVAPSLGSIGLTRVIRPSVSVIPIILSAHYWLALGPRLNLHLSAGPGLYVSSFRFREQYDLPILIIDTSLSYAPKPALTIGFQGLMGFEMGLSDSFWLTLDVVGRLASVTGLNGDWTKTGHSFGGPFTTSGVGSLWSFEDKVDGTTYIFTQVSDRPPNGSSFGDIRNASIGLSGVGARIGLRIKL